MTFYIVILYYIFIRWSDPRAPRLPCQRGDDGAGEYIILFYIILYYILYYISLAAFLRLQCQGQRQGPHPPPRSLFSVSLLLFSLPPPSGPVFPPSSRPTFRSFPLRSPPPLPPHLLRSSPALPPAPLLSFLLSRALPVHQQPGDSDRW